MARVTGAEVKEIIDTTLTEAQCDAFIQWANIIVNNRLANSGLSSTTKKEIERWLAAHAICMRDPRIVNQKIGDASETYEFPKTQGNLMLERTAYGQQALMLDESGSLTNLGKRKTKIQTIYESDDSSS